MRLLAVILTASWAGIAIAVASAYRPGGPIDFVVALACFAPVLVADAGVVWPPSTGSHRARLVLLWTWIAAILLAIPVLYGIVANLADGGPRNLVPSIEAAYGGALALGAMTFFSIVGLVHHRRGIPLLDRSAAWLAVVLTVALTAAQGLAFVFVAVVSDQVLRESERSSSRFGPTDPDAVPSFCHEPLRLGGDATVTIEAASSTGGEERGVARLQGKRDGRDEAWGAAWRSPDGAGQAAYLRIGSLAWLNTQTDDPDAPGSTWGAVPPDPFGLVGTRQLTMDGPPHAIANVPRGDIVAEDLGLEIIDGARARHCRTFIDGPTALDTFLPLRWLLVNDSFVPEGAIRRWRGEMDWWVFTDGELGMASVEVSGSRAATNWQSEDVRAVLEARLEATDRNTEVDVSAPFDTGDSSPASQSPDASPAPALGSDAP